MNALAAITLLAALAATFVACGDDPAATPGVAPHTSTPPSAVNTIIISATATPATSEATPDPDATTPRAPAPPAPVATAVLAPDRTFALAPIDAAEMVIRESAPPQYAVHITSGLPNGCAQFGDAVALRTGDEITITVRNTVPSDARIACTQVYGTREMTVELGTDFVTGTQYMVRVNDRTIDFTPQ